MHRDQGTNRTDRPKRPRGRLAGIAAAALAAVLIPVTMPAHPAQAVAVNTQFTGTVPATWVDDQGRQYEIVSTTGGTLNVARDTATGMPDTTWGPSGVKGLVLTPPATGATLPSQVAASDDGVLTIAYTEPGCAESGVCDRLIARYDGVTGDAIGSAVTVTDEREVFRALDDGSVLLGTTATALHWYGPDGALRASPGLTGSQLDGADPDAAGRLLVLAADGTLTRWPATQPVAPDLTIDTDCGAEMPGGAVGAAADGGFAVVCAESGAGAPTTTRYLASGTVSWTLPGSTANVVGIPVQRVTVDASDRVWYGGFAPGTVWLFIVPGRLSVASVTAAGPGPVAYTRATGSFGGTPYVDVAGGGITDLRTTADGSHVVLADLKLCCQYQSNRSYSTAAYGEVLPYRPSPPRCRVGSPQVSQVSGGDVSVHFGACAEGRPNSRPTSYRVEASGAAGDASATAADTGAGTGITVTLPGLTAAQRSVITVTPVNNLGDSTVAPEPIATVLPFRTVDAFVDRQIATLGGKPLEAADRASYIGAVTTGALSPGGAMEEILGNGPARGWVEPMARVYRAAFLRDADIGGLRYWAGRRSDGVRIATIAEQFTRSSEFRRRYGTLSNRGFVQQIYRNVLGRDGDAAGIDFWTRRLDAHTATRGTVLAGFSESGEFVRKTNGLVQPLTVTFLMLDRRPTAAEKATWSTSEAVYADMPAAVLATAQYAARIAGT